MFEAWLGLAHLISQIQLCMKCAYVDLGQVMFGIFNVPNPTMSRINISMFEAWLGLAHLMPQIQLCMKCDYVDLGHVMFGTLGVLNLTMFQINISMFDTWSGLVSHTRNPTMIQTYLR